MLLWRISNHDSLDGAGGLRAPGRWHNRGNRIVYFATSVPGALVEHLVHLELSANLIPDHFSLMKVGAQEDILVESIATADLPSQWASRLEVTRKIGDLWLRQKRSALLLVPSAIVPETVNALLNPRHPEITRLQRFWHRSFRLDDRLVHPHLNEE